VVKLFFFLQLFYSFAVETVTFWRIFFVAEFCVLELQFRAGYITWQALKFRAATAAFIAEDYFFFTFSLPTSETW